ncbi:MAG: GAF domain-containing protein, partial [Chloroflexi bacterium]|nr:GAF domain-containing protein [Chloroflexota bacterium]
MPPDPSLFSLIATSHSNRLFQQGIDVLNVLNAQIQQTILSSMFEPHVFVGVQTFSSFELYAASYGELARHSRKITVLGEADVRPRSLNNTEFIALPSGSALTKERFLIINDPSWQVMLLAQVLAETTERPGRQQRYQGLLTFSTQTIERCNMLASMLAGQPAQPVGRAEPMLQQQHIAQFVMRLALMQHTVDLNLPQLLVEVPALVDVAKQVAQQPSMVARLQWLINQSRALIRTDSITIYRKEDTMLRPVVSTHPLDQVKGIVNGQGMIGGIVNTPQLVVVDGTAAAHESSLANAQSVLAMPIFDQSGEQMWGVVAYGTSRGGAFGNPPERVPLATITGMISGIVFDDRSTVEPQSPPP